jgi:hypothetical protein
VSAGPRLTREHLFEQFHVALRDYARFPTRTGDASGLREAPMSFRRLEDPRDATREAVWGERVSESPVHPIVDDVGEAPVRKATTGVPQVIDSTAV